MKTPRRKTGSPPRADSKSDHGRAHRARPSRVEPSTFAWVEPLDELEPVVVEKIVEKIVEKQVVVEKPVIIEKPTAPTKSARVRFKDAKAASKAGDTEGKTVIIGRGPSFTERMVRVAPNPKPVLAGACALIVALAGVALVSPNGERATAARSTSPLGVAEQPSGTQPATIGLDGVADANVKGDSRDPFAAKNFKPKPVAKSKTGNKKTGDKGENGQDRAKGGRRATTPATAKPSLFAAGFVTYSSYTPWTKIRRRSGGWVQFGGKPTVKVVAVSENLVELFVVTDVEVLLDKSRGVSYSNPLRVAKVKPGGVVRFADYRDIQGEDVEYTIRFSGALPVNISPAA
ncbi:MAG: hypothetical protein HY827_02200 [Actinobacteria bacterium]|nr:hypothetical protein [Actinomycetota bacterium]